MDIRKQKTQQAIRDAFLQLRSEKNLEQITVTELAKAARISKATFYLHYRDIYDLSEQMQQDAVRRVLAHIPSPLDILVDQAQFSRNVVSAMDEEADVMNILFSGLQAAVFPISLEAEIKKRIFSEYPHLKDDAGLNVQLSYHIHGGYYAYMENVHSIGSKRVLEQIDNIHATAPIIIERCP